MSTTTLTIKPKSHYVQLKDLFVLPDSDKKFCEEMAISDGVSCSSHIAGDPTLTLAFFDHLWEYAYPRFSKIPFVTRIARNIAKDCVINTAILFEKAISKTGKIKRDATVGRDFVDLSDAKSVSVRLRNLDKTYSANVADLKTKQGAIRIICYERVTKKFYYFIVPADKNPRTSIEIPFNLDGWPNKNSHWWRYEVNSFVELCRPV